MQPYYDEDASTHENKSPNTTVLRAQHSGDRKLDDNNNFYTFKFNIHKMATKYKLDILPLEHYRNENRT